ncbi:magnesium transporter CorA family protein [Noviherbaspirillum galbum]|uniref:Magnesium transporter CorA family protein n=1 Tax=Noviherbaspirillum galbum TaxID=2709383 RepID=A0A6B3SL00_9BURK|nr:magnesium transporter CorA family protein [Noviherbaspirillum galbum]NEX61481.1 magnesium transporter CorA family protein [Noviherbaspirillum galbum]
MDIYQLSNGQFSLLPAAPASLPAEGFLWLDVTHDEIAADPAAWRQAVESITGTHVYDPHLRDAVNLAHPTYFDSTQDYAMVVFRKLALDGADQTPEPRQTNRRIPAALTKLATRPVTFMIMDRALVTVRAAQSRTVETLQAKLRESRARQPGSPEELMLRLLNAMVDQYLDLRHPLTAQIDRWQRALLSPQHPFNDWNALLDARIELRKLDQLCEGQHDAMQEFRDHVVDTIDPANPAINKDLLLVRVNDVMEHVSRVLHHAQRLEATLESAVQIHFSAMAHRTSEIMRTLTVITALFMPLTLITGIFGMNFNDMPLLKSKDGFWITMGVMAVIVAALLFFFRRKKYLDDQP